MSFVIWVVKELYILPLYWSIFEATKWAKQFTFILLHLYSNILGSFLSFTISLSGLQQFFHNLSFVHKCLMWCDRVSLIRYYFFLLFLIIKITRKLLEQKLTFDDSIYEVRMKIVKWKKLTHHDWKMGKILISIRY